MTAADTTVAAPARRSRWWTALLLASLALNLFVGGLVASHVLAPGPRVERMTMDSFLSIIPKRFFFGDLDRGRRDAMMERVKGLRDRFRAGQKASRQAAMGLADAVAATPYDAAKVRVMLDGFSRNSSELVAIGADAAFDFITGLTDQERAQLATRIRDRASRPSRK